MARSPITLSENQGLLARLGLRREDVLRICTKMNPVNGEIYRLRSAKIWRAAKEEGREIETDSWESED